MRGKKQALFAALRRNGGMKLAALLLASVLWYSIREAISFETVLNDVPIDILHDDGWAVLDRSDETVDIRFRGSRADIANVSREQTKVIVDMKGLATGGQHLVPLRPDHVKIGGSGARAVYLRPERITVSLDREGERPVPVKADIQGAVPDGYEVEKIVCTPASVLLKGPLARLQEVDMLRTQPIDFEGRVQSFKVRKSVAPPSSVWTARMEPDRVLVEVALKESAALRTMENVPIKLLALPGSKSAGRVDPTRVNVVLQGRSEILGAMSVAQMRAYVDGSDLTTPARYDLPVQIHLVGVSGVRVISIEPQSVAVTID